MTATLVAPTRITPSAAQLQQTQQAIDSYIQRIDTNPDRRIGAYPYYRFHAPGEAILGTIMIFHGFSAKPHQMWRLTEYLFQNGYNIYQPSIAGHVYLPPSKHWCQVDLKPEIADPLRAKVAQDPVLQLFLANLATSQNFSRPSYTQRLALMAKLKELDPRLEEIITAIEGNGDDATFQKYFISNHMEYLSDARDRLQELDAMPGDIYTLGLSVGGAVALGLAADRPDRIKKTIVYAPLLEIYGEDRREYVNLAGPLDIKELGWDPNLRFPVGALTAAARFGKSVVKNAAKLSKTPTFMVLTENEDAADIQTNQDFFQAIGGTPQGHQSFLYPASDLVPHPMVDPTEVSQGMSNRFWQTLYQETYRFLSTGKATLENMEKIQQDTALAIVAN